MNQSYSLYLPMFRDALLQHHRQVSDFEATHEPHPSAGEHEKM